MDRNFGKLRSPREGAEPYPPICATPMNALEQWLRARPGFAALRDSYLLLCRDANGPVGVLGEWAALFCRETATVGLRAEGLPSRCAPRAAEWALILSPFWALNRLETKGLWREALEQGARGLVPGGRMAFDVRCSGTGTATKTDRLPRLAADGDAGDGRRRIIWETWRRSASGKRDEGRLGVEEVAPGGGVTGKSYISLSLRLMSPEEIRNLALSQGFIVEADGEAPEAAGGAAEGRMWILRKKGGPACSDTPPII